RRHRAIGRGAHAAAAAGLVAGLVAGGAVLQRVERRLAAVIRREVAVAVAPARIALLELARAGAALDLGVLDRGRLVARAAALGGVDRRLATGARVVVAVGVERGARELAGLRLALRGRDVGE